MTTKYLDKAGLDRFYDNLTGKFQTISQVNDLIAGAANGKLEDPEILSVFMGANEIWIDSENWSTMVVFTDTNDAEGTALTINSHGYYVFNTSGLNSADTFEIATSSAKTVTTGVIASTLAGITDYNGKIIKVTANSTTPEVLFPVVES